MLLSILAMVLPTAVQIVAVDKSSKRRLLSFFQMKLLVDGFKSLKGEEMTAGYGTAKFTEGVYEALPEVGPSLCNMQISRLVTGFFAGYLADILLPEKD